MLSPEQIADMLLDYETGEVKDVGHDYLHDYQRLIGRVEEKMRNHPRRFPEDQPVFVISDVARAMMKRIVLEGERREKEVALSLQGGYFERENGNHVFVVAFAAPASNFMEAEKVHVNIDPQLQKGYAKKLAQITNLDDFFMNHEKAPQGFPTAVLHLHYRRL